MNKMVIKVKGVTVYGMGEFTPEDLERIRRSEERLEAKLTELREAAIRSTRLTAEDYSVTITRCEPKYKPRNQ